MYLMQVRLIGTASATWPITGGTSLFGRRKELNVFAPGQSGNTGWFTIGARSAYDVVKVSIGLLVAILNSLPARLFAGIFCQVLVRHLFLRLKSQRMRNYPGAGAVAERMRRTFPFAV